MRNSQGQFTKGHHSNPETEFRQGEHWRDRKPYWAKGWLRWEYHIKGKTAAEIAAEWGVGTTAITYWLNKHGIQTRTMAETRKIKKWGSKGEDNGMFGRCGPDNPHWRGGITQERQTCYASQEWKDAASVVWKRDKATCQRCGIQNDNADETLHIHHIVPFECREARTDVDNLVLLCRDCHNFVHSSDNTTKDFIGTLFT